MVLTVIIVPLKKLILQGPYFNFTVAADQCTCVDCHYSFSPHDAHTYHVYISNITF